MSNSKIPSPARSQGTITPRRYKTRSSRSVGSPARSNTSTRLTAIVQMDSFKLSPFHSRRSVLNDDTDIEVPGRKSWWKKLNENSQDVMEILSSQDMPDANNMVEEYIDVEVLSQEKKNYTLDLPESSDGESINSIVIPQRKLFMQKENRPQKKFAEIRDTRESLAKLHKSNIDAVVNVAPKNLFSQGEKRSKPIFPAALLNISANKTTVANKTNELAANEVKSQARNLFGNRPGTKRKNMFADFIVSESEDEIPEIQPKVFGFQKKADTKRRDSTASRGLREQSPASNTTDIEMDDWKLLPSSTMINNQLEDIEQTPVKRARLSKLSEAKESEIGNSTSVTNKTKQSNRSINSKNESKDSSNIIRKNMDTANFINFMEDDDEHIFDKADKIDRTVINKSTANAIIINKSQVDPMQEKQTEDSSKRNISKVNQLQNNVQNKSKPANNVSIEIEKEHKPGTTQNASQENKKHINYEEPMETNDEKIEQRIVENHEEPERNQVDVHNYSKSKQEYYNKTQINENGAENEQADIQDKNKSGQQQEKIINANEIEYLQRGDTSLHESEAEPEEKQGAEESEDKSESEQEQEIENDNESEQEQEIEDDNESEQEQEIEVNNESEQEEEIEDNNESGQEQEIEDDDENELVQKKSADIQENMVELKEIEKDEVEQENINESANNEQEEIEHNKTEQQEKDIEGDLEKEEEHKKNVIKRGETDDIKEDEAEQEQISENEAEYIHGSEAEQEEFEVDSESEKEPEDNEDVDENEEVREELEDVDESETEQEEIADVSQIEAEQEEIRDDNESEEELKESGDINESKQEEEIDKSNDNENEHEEGIEEDSDQEMDEANESALRYSEEEHDDETSPENESENEEMQEDSIQEDRNDEQSEEQIVESENENEQEVEREEDQQESDQNHESDDNMDASPDITHDTTGRHRNKDNVKSPEAILHDKTNQMESFAGQGRNTSIRKTKSIVQQLNIRPSLAPVRESTGLSDGTRDSSAEGSGWDSHRTTRKTIRQTLGRDFTIRKSLRALVMEKSAKRHTNVVDVNEISKFPQANSTEFDHEPVEIDETPDPIESDHEISRATRQTTLETYLQKIKKENIERKRKMEEEIRGSLKAPPKDNFIFKVPTKPVRRITKTAQSKAKPKPFKSIIPLDMLPSEVLEDMKYKPPRRYQPTNAPWITKRLYKFLEAKLEPKYDYKARIRAEKLVETIYNFTKNIRRHDTAPTDAVDVLKHEMARLDVVKSHFDFYEFFHEYMPREIRVKVIPDVVNKISLPKHGVFADILR